MYCNLTRIQGFPMAIRGSLQGASMKSIHTPKSSNLTVGFYLNPKGDTFTDVSSGFYRNRCNSFGLLKGENVRVHSLLRSTETGTRVFSSLNAQRSDNPNSSAKAENSLPWLEESEKGSKNRFRSSWEESAKRMNKGNSDSIWVESTDREVKERVNPKAKQSFWEKKDRRNEYVEDRRSKYRMTREIKPLNSIRAVENDRFDEGEDEQEEMEIVDDPRWPKIKNRLDRFVDVRENIRGKREYRKWDKQEAWGKKTYKEATESTIPKMVGQSVYGVGPVLAALTVGRREFYGLYVQEGLDMSSNNRKKKDKKGFERILKIVEKLGLSVKEISKHDLNMIVDNRPHQGLVLDASPLEMVKVKELDPITSEDEKSSIWVALDEVTDPQNLGAIIRSAYFFGVTGIVVCAKNSAPLSGVVSKSSAGSLEVMEIRYCKNMMQFLTSSAENGWRVIGGSVSSKAVPLNDVSCGTPTILVLGNEGTGLRPLVERSCTELVRINGNVAVDIGTGENDEAEAEGEDFRSFMAVESLNVSVAAALFLHHLIGNK